MSWRVIRSEHSSLHRDNLVTVVHSTSPREASVGKSGRSTLFPEKYGVSVHVGAYGLWVTDLLTEVPLCTSECGGSVRK